jgi:hypothetical protein
LKNIPLLNSTVIYVIYLSCYKFRFFVYHVINLYRLNLYRCHLCIFLRHLEKFFGFVPDA